jgi:hypothetical protein
MLSLNDDRKNLGLGNKNQKNRTGAETERKSATKTSTATDGAIIYFGFYWFILVFFWPVRCYPECPAIGIIRLDGRSSIRHYQAQKEKRPASPLA